MRAGSLPRGKAEERMMQVMTREIPGSKYKVHRPSQLIMSIYLEEGRQTYNQMTRPAAITPTFPRLED